MTRVETAERTRELLGSFGIGPASPVGSALVFSFSAMDVAEEALEARYGAEEPEGAFSVLRPRYEAFAGMERLLEPHYREILDRIDADEDTRPGTMAEVVAAISRLSLAGPLDYDVFEVACYAFAEALGDETAEEVYGAEHVRRARDDFRANPRLPEILEEYRSGLRDEERVR